MPRNSQSEFTVKIHTSYSWELLGKIPRQKKEEVAKPRIEKLANFSPIPRFVVFNLNYFANIWKTLSLKCFQIAPANIKRVTSKLAVFTYSHLN